MKKQAAVILPETPIITVRKLRLARLMTVIGWIWDVMWLNLF